MLMTNISVVSLLRKDEMDLENFLKPSNTFQSPSPIHIEFSHINSFRSTKKIKPACKVVDSPPFPFSFFIPFLKSLHSPQLLTKA